MGEATRCKCSLNSNPIAFDNGRPRSTSGISVSATRNCTSLMRTGIPVCCRTMFNYRLTFQDALTGGSDSLDFSAVSSVIGFSSGSAENSEYMKHIDGEKSECILK